MAEYITPIRRLIEEFRRLPGVGGKTAARYAFATLDLTDEEAASFAEAILAIKRDVHKCPVCFGFCSCFNSCNYNLVVAVGNILVYAHLVEILCFFAYLLQEYWRCCTEYPHVCIAILAVRHIRNIYHPVSIVFGVDGPQFNIEYDEDSHCQCNAHRCACKIHSGEQLVLSHHRPCLS